LDDDGPNLVGFCVSGGPGTRGAASLAVQLQLPALALCDISVPRLPSGV